MCLGLCTHQVRAGAGRPRGLGVLRGAERKGGACSKLQDLQILSANVTSYYSVNGLVEAIGGEVDIVLIQEHRLHGDALEAANKFVKGHGFYSHLVSCEARGLGKVLVLLLGGGPGTLLWGDRTKACSTEA